MKGKGNGEEGGGTRIKRTEAEKKGRARGSGDDQIVVDLAITSFEYRKERYFSVVFRDMTQDKLFQVQFFIFIFIFILYLFNYLLFIFSFYLSINTFPNRKKIPF